jgi:glycosyltransferase involved in cell wall biosynthesis
VNAFALYTRYNPGAKLHIYGATKNQKGWGALLKKIKDENGLGEVLPWVKGLENVYRAADLMITPHTISTRSIRESLACGCPVLHVDEHNFSAESIKVALNQSRSQARKLAEKRYNPINTALKFKEICLSVGKTI